MCYFLRLFFHTVKVSSVFSQSENNVVVMSRYVLHTVSKISEKHVDLKKNVINRKFSVIEIEYGFYFTWKTGLFTIFTCALYSWKYQKSCHTCQMNSAFNIKTLNILKEMCRENTLKNGEVSLYSELDICVLNLLHVYPTYLILVKFHRVGG